MYGTNTVALGEEAILVFRVWNKSGVALGHTATLRRVLGAHLHVLGGPKAAVQPRQMQWCDAYGNKFPGADGHLNVIDNLPPNCSAYIRCTVC